MNRNTTLQFLIKFIAQNALPVGVLLLVMLMIVPVPKQLLDTGFILNIMVSLAVLMVAMNVAKPLDFSSFPTVLLLATVFRLALNVASTRVVLVNGHLGPDAAGQVIEAFGALMIGNDYLVGIFVFTILIIINLIVITKGAGRVAEVSARFTLDALPGKQMAIDADLNAGLVTADEARARRREIATEADFYGSMDGASKFVKGDAVAGILILLVNIIGGLTLGVFSHDLSFSEAAETYMVLAIGDALVAQVPALLLSIAAAAIVTRVSSPLDLAGQIANEFGVSRAWGPVAGILALIGLIPAMPQIVILPAAAVAGLIYFRLLRFEKLPVTVAEPIIDPTPDNLIEWNEVGDMSPITLELGYGLVSLIDERRGAPLMARVTGVRRQLSREFGFVIPMVKVSDNLSLPGNAYQIRISGVLVGEDQAWADELLALDSGDCLEGITGRAVKDPSFGLDALWIAESDSTNAVAAGYTVVDAATVITTHLNQLASASAAELFGMDDAQALINNLKDTYPNLAAGLVPAPYTLAAVTTLSRALLSERVPLRDFRRIAEAMIDVAPRNLEMAQLIELVRQQLGGLIVQTIVPVNMPLPAITFDGELDTLLVQSAQSAPQASWPFEPQLAQRIISVIGEAVQPMQVAARSCAIITSPSCRAAVGRLLRSQYSDVAVLSFLEIPETKKVDIIAVVGGTSPLPPPDVGNAAPNMAEKIGDTDD